MELLTILSMVDSKGDACRIHLICNSASACFNSTDHISACKKIRFRSISCTDNQLHYSVTKIIQSSTMNLNSQLTRRWSILATACRGLQGIWPARGVAGMRLPSKLSTLAPAGSVLQGSWKLLPWTTSTMIGVFGLRSEVLHHLLSPHFLYLVCGMEWVDPSPPHLSQVNN